MQPVQTYQQALDYLYGYILPTAPLADVESRYARARALLRAVGDPHTAFPSVVIAGTKGKGSTTAMIAAICRAAGLRTGMWTSPHLHSYRERIQVDGVPISQTALIAAVNRIAPAVEVDDTAGGLPTTFAIGFALAMRYFAEQHVDIAVVEVGLGGRYDSANLLTPLVSVITSISYDHMDVLGESIVDIAMQKGGIAKHGVPLLVAPQPYAALVTVAACAAEAGAPCRVVDDHGDGGIRGDDPADDTTRGPIPELSDPFTVYHGPQQPALAGGFQRENARLAVAAALELRARFPQIDDAAIATGLATVQWPGRYERVLVDGVAVLFDGAHNLDSAQRLSAALRHDYVGVSKTFIVGCSRDKDIASMIPALVETADQVIVTASRHPRAWRDLGSLRALVCAARPDIQVIGIDDPADALRFAVHHAEPHSMIVVTGSLFVVAAGREAAGIAAAVD